jgi:dipeptidyl aminopeptidase/acylaminoacyl peptidase
MRAIGTTPAPCTRICSMPLTGRCAKASRGATRWYRRCHDPRTAEGRGWLWSRSPLSRVDQIRQPLLIGHGQNDVRRKLAESEQIVAAMRENGLPVRYLVYPDESHGFIRPENRLSFLVTEEAFYAEHFGTRCEPV